MFNSENFDESVLSSDIPVIVDFFASWCGPCKAMAQTIDNLSTSYENKILVGKLDVEVSPEIAERYDVMSVPTIIFFKNGEVAHQEVGSLSENNLKKLATVHLL